MNYTVISSAEYAYPDRFSYPSSSDHADVFGARGGYASFQVVLRDVSDEALKVTCEGFAAELYVLYPIPVEKNIGFQYYNVRPHMPERIAPYEVYDALMPYRGKVVVTGGQAGLYVAIKLSRDAQPGITEGTLVVGDLRIPVRIETMSVQLPPESLKFVQGYCRNLERYHGVRPGTPEYDRLNDAYFSLMRRMHQNMAYVGGVVCTRTGKNRFSFDFSGMEREIEYALAHGMKYVNGPSVGWRQSWQASTILLNGDIPAMSYEGYCYLSQYLPALHDVLERHGWLDIFVMGVADEPNNFNATEYRALCGLIRRFVPDIKLIDAMSFGDLHGALDIWVPLISSYTRHREELESLRGKNDEIWYYVCLYPRGQGYVNRHMDYALMSTRMLHWGNYKYHLTGFLHWAVNYYQEGFAQADGKEYHQDPFVCSCPEHHNTDSVSFLPAGDTHVFYPGGYHGHGDVQEPWLSMRAENERESVEEYELLRELSLRDPQKADEICERVFHNFNDYEYDLDLFEKTRRTLMEALSSSL